MILGVLDKSKQGSEFSQNLFRLTAGLSSQKGSIQPKVWNNSHLAVSRIPPQSDPLDGVPQPFISEDQRITLMFEGKIYNSSELRTSLIPRHKFLTDCSGELLVHLYEQNQKSFLDQVNGKFAFILWDDENRKLILGRDRFGIESLFYHDDGRRLVFGSSLKWLLATGWIDKELNREAVLQYLQYCYNPGAETFLRNIYKVPAGHLLLVDSAGASLKKYWTLSFAKICIKTEEQYREEIPTLIEDAIRIRLEPGKSPGVFLSGGTDSSTIVSLAARMAGEPLRTFSFRCEGRSYDESRYARLVAGQYGTRHTEIPYRHDHLKLISRAVESMDEPFCDIGIEIGTYLLGQAAQGQVPYVFSGEGGDELFGGHPVYIADKVAAIVDRVPQVMLNPFARILQRIPDSDQKKNVQVKLKRFAYSLSFPPELLSHRWRTYYTPKELRALCTDDLIDACDMQHLYDSIYQYNMAADGGDPLSRSLYSDYYTIVDFYLRRLKLLRAFAVESRLPLLDYRLVEYAAQIPSALKIRRLSESKYIYRKVLEKVLPRAILYDRPKLGHSVPMKNWLRDDTESLGWMAGVLGKEAVSKRGFFRPSVIQKFVQEHATKRQNHSHRLWALVVLEFWLRTWFDT